MQYFIRNSNHAFHTFTYNFPLNEFNHIFSIHRIMESPTWFLRPIIDIYRPMTNKIIYIQIYGTVTKDYYLIPDNDAKNLLRPIIDIYRPVTNKIIYIQIYGTITKDYYLILGNDAKNLLRPIIDIYRPVTNKIIYIQIYGIVTKDYYLILDNDAKNMLRNEMKICVCPFCKLNLLKILIGLNLCKCTDRTSNKKWIFIKSKYCSHED